MIRLPDVSVVLLKLKPQDFLTVTSGRFPEMQVNGRGIYAVESYHKDYSPFRVKRSVRGTVLLIPSSYRSDYTFENGQFVDRWDGLL